MVARCVCLTEWLTCVLIHVCVCFYGDAGGPLKMRIFKKARREGGKWGGNLGPLVFVYKSQIFLSVATLLHLITGLFAVNY